MAQYSFADQVVLAPWDVLIRRLADRGWATTDQVVQSRLLFQLYREYRSRFDPPPEDSQRAANHRALGAEMDLHQARPAVADLALRLSASLSVASELQRLAPPPLFSRVTWTCSPPFLEDLPAVPVAGRSWGISATIMLAGQATFSAVDARGSRRRRHGRPGGLLMVRHGRWPRPYSSAVGYEIQFPASASTLVMTFV